MEDLKGEITVFLSLILLLILSLVGTIIEVSRVNTAKTFAERALITAMDSTLTKFYGPILSDYNIMLLDMGYKTGNLKEEVATSEMIEDMEYTFKPNKGISLLGTGLEVSNLDLYNINIEQISIEDKTFITDYDGKLLLNQIIEYMKYRVNGDMVKNILKKLSLLKESKSATEVIGEKLAVEQKLLELDEYSMELMELVDGVSFGKTGIMVKSNGLVKTKKNFVKKLSVGGNSMESVGINNEIIYKSLKSSYIDPCEYIDNMIDSGKLMIEYNQERDAINQEGLKLTEELSKVLEQEQDNELKKKKNNKKEEKVEDIKENSGKREKEINEIKERENKLNKRLAAIDKEYSGCLDDINSNKRKIQELVNDTVPKIEEAMKIIEKYKEKQKVLKGEVENLETTLNNKKNDVDEEFYNSIKLDVESMKNYVNNGSDNKDGKDGLIDTVKLGEYLKSNYNLLSNLEFYDNVVGDNKEEEAVAFYNYSKEIKGQISAYYVKELHFDYSSFTLVSDSNNPVKNFKELLKNGVLELVLDDVSQVSKKELSQINLPSILYGENEIEKGNEDSLQRALSSGSEEGCNEDIRNAFNEFQDENMQIDIKDNIGSKLIETVLFLEYISNHFNHYVIDEKEKINNQETALEYEQEYLVIGNKKDKVNLEKVIMKIINTRTILNLIYLIGDSKRSKEAYLTAAALVGISGLAPLVHLTKMIILMVWSYEEALIDMNALLKGKSVPLIKNQSNFILNYNELLSVNKEFIKTKAESYKKEGDAGFNGFEYKDYIKLLLVTKKQKVKLYRCMDLMQTNMNKRYNDGFLIKNCVFGFSTRAKFNIAAKFIRLPLLKKSINFKEESFEYNIIRSYSY